MLSDLRYRLRALFRRDAMERELDQELRFHYDQLVANYSSAGLTPDDAARRARLDMGGMPHVQEACRDARGISLLETSAQDIRYAFRKLRAQPVFALVVIVSLALGIGANTAMFTLIDAVLLRSLPVEDPSTLAFVDIRQPGGTRTFGYDEFRKLEAANPAFTDLAAFGSTRLNVSIDGSIEPTAEGQLVSGTYFSLLGIRAIAGRTIGPEDDRVPNGHPVAVLSYGYWSRRFARSPDAIGRTIVLSGRPFAIIGVAPRDFFGVEVGRAPDIFVPIVMQPAVMPAAENWLLPSINRSFWLTVVGRLPSDRTPQQAASALAGIDVLNVLMRKPMRPGDQPERIPERLDLSPAAAGISNLRDQFSQPLLILMAAVMIVLLIASANVASLIVARSASRHAEFAMRLALGAGRRRLIRQLLTESVLLAGAGGLCGLLLARWATELLVTMMSSGRTPIALGLEPDARILAFTATISVLAGLLCGVTPAFRAARVDLITGLKGQSRGTADGSWMRPGRWLVAAQVGLCLVLLFGAGLFVRSFRAIDSQNGGTDRDRVLIMRIEPKGSDQRGVPGTSARLDRTYRDLMERLESLPGVRAASFAQVAPTIRTGYAAPLTMASGEHHVVERLMVYPGYFETMGIGMRSGRDLDDRELGANAPFVAVVNEAFARRIAGGRNPLGMRFVEREGHSREIVGVVEDTRYANPREETPPMIYQPFLQTATGRGQMTLFVRVSDDSPAVVASVRSEVQRVDREAPLFAIHTLAAQMAGALSRERLVATLSTTFGLLALLLSCVGLYGLMSFAVAGRRGEIGIRLALGAARSSVVTLIMRDALTLVAIGLAIGAVAAWIAGRLGAGLISGLLFGLNPTDLTTLAGAAVVLTMVAAIAALLPAVRAGRVEVVRVLRD